MDTIEQRDEECEIPKHWQVQGCNASIEEAGAKILRKGLPTRKSRKKKIETFSQTIIFTVFESYTKTFIINFTVTTTVTMNARPHTINAVGDIFVLIKAKNNRNRNQILSNRYL